MKLICVVMIVLASVCAGANAEAQSLNLPSAAYLTAAGADGATTYYALTRFYTTETSPYLRGLNGHPTAVVAVGTGIDVASVWALNHFLGKKPKLVKIALYAGTAWRLSLAARNIGEIRKSQRR
jgi:hypothetical protein